MSEFKKKFCPNCGSSNIKWTIPQLWSIWECFNCGYRGSVVIENDELAQKIKKDYKAKQKEV